MYEQVYEPVNANSDGNLTIILEPDGTASVLYGVYVPEGESCRTIVILYVAYWLMIKGLVSMLIGLNSKVEVVHDIIIMTYTNIYKKMYCPLYIFLWPIVY